jgi:hypothetical protein
MWFDGNAQGGYNTSTWTTLITNRMNQPSPITESIWGEYNMQTGSGTIYARFQNDSNASINANVLFVITEDNIAVSAPNGDNMHNHVARAYIPSYNGTSVTVNVGTPVTVSYPFTISPSWNGHNIEIVAMIQNPIAVGTTKEILQGAKIELLNLPGVEESRNDIPITPSNLTVLPNPCVNEARFNFTLPSGTQYRIGVFDISGREVKSLNGVATGRNELVNCDLRGAVNSGVYFYKFESNIANTSGKIIVK